MSSTSATFPESVDNARAAELVGAFPGRRILVVGDAVVDRYVLGGVERLNPEAPVPILKVRSERVETGAAGNTAKNAAALGAKTTLISVVGDDAGAASLREAASQEGYAATLITDSDRPTIEKRRYIVRGQQMLRVDREETHDITGDVEQAVVAAITKAAAEADAIIVSDYAKGVVTAAVAEAVMSAAKQHDIPVMADVKPSRIKHFVGASYLSPNRKEAHEYLGIDQHDRGGRPATELASQLHQQFEATVFLTLSEEGLYVYGVDTTGAYVPQLHQIEVADTSGCGDTAAVALVLAKLAGATDIEAGHMANAAGAVVAAKIGAVTCAPDELLHILEHREPLAVERQARSSA